MSSLTLLAFTYCLLLATTYGASLAKRDPKDEDATTLIYTGTHDIVTLGVSRTLKNVQGQAGNHNTSNNESIDKTIFFIEADINDNGKRINHVLFVLKDGVKTKLLDNARDIAVVNGSNPVYFGAKDGIYLYNENKNTAEKYGTTTDDIINIAAEVGTGVLYYLNRQYQLYKVTEQGNKYTIVDDVKNAQAMEIDFTGHIYYYVEDKTFYVYDGHVVRQINNIPKNLTKIFFVKIPIMDQHIDSTLVVGDGQTYVMMSNSTAEMIDESDNARNVTAGLIYFDHEPNFYIYYAEDKKIYELNVGKLLKSVISAIFHAISEKIDSYLRNIKLN